MSNGAEQQRAWDLAAGESQTVYTVVGTDQNGQQVVEQIEDTPSMRAFVEAMSAPRALLPEASALWLKPGTPARPLSMRESALMWWRLREWERRAKAWFGAMYGRAP